MRRAIAFISACAIVVTIAFGSGGAIAAERDATAASELSAIQTIERFLIAAKIDPGEAVIQRGARNYAGADCPGADWNCTTASVVVQIGVAKAPNASNQFDCDPASAGSDEGTSTCVVVQLAPEGKKANNHARCRISGIGPVQTCTIDQTNLTGGSNHAHTDMDIDVRGGADQTGQQTATVRQRTSTGDNNSHLKQNIRLTTDDVSAGIAGMQKQVGKQTAVVCQGGATPASPDCPTTPTEGSNKSHVDQSLSLRATAAGGDPIVQSQNLTGGTTTDCFGLASPNTAADIDQLTTSGRNQSDLKQANDLDGTVRDVPGDDVVQIQGSASGGLEGCVFQSADATGFSTSHASQHDSQTLKGPPGAEQDQFGPEFCCTTQVGPGKVNIDQHKSQSSTSSTQVGLVTGHCLTPNGECRLDQRASNNVDSERNSCSGTECNEVVRCTSSTFIDEETGEEMTVGDCTSDPIPPEPD